MEAASTKDGKHTETEVISSACRLTESSEGLLVGCHNCSVFMHGPAVHLCMYLHNIYVHISSVSMYISAVYYTCISSVSMHVLAVYLCISAVYLFMYLQYICVCIAVYLCMHLQCSYACFYSVSMYASAVYVCI